MIAVAGFCPMGCGQTLTLGATGPGGGRVWCSATDCPEPEAVSHILGDHRTEHIVALREDDFTVKHPLRERLDDALMSCVIDEHLTSLSSPPHPPGVYSMIRAGEHWNYHRIGDLP
jgi:hypothetical protein